VSTNDIPADLLKSARTICLALPEALEKETWDHPTFRVRDKIFAGVGSADNDIFAEGQTDAPVVTMSMKAAPGEQESLLAQGSPFFKPKYVGSKGWIGVVIDENTDWGEVAELVRDSYIAIAPKKLSKDL